MRGDRFFIIYLFLCLFCFLCWLSCPVTVTRGIFSYLFILFVWMRILRVDLKNLILVLFLFCTGRKEWVFNG